MLPICLNLFLCVPARAWYSIRSYGMFLCCLLHEKNGFCSAWCYVFLLLMFPPCEQITQRLLSLTMPREPMDYAEINREILNGIVDDSGLKRDQCRGFMLDGGAAKTKAIDCLLINFKNAVGVWCSSHLLHSCGSQLVSRQIDAFAGHLHTLLAHSHRAKYLWRRETKVPPPKPASSHFWGSRLSRNETLVNV